MNIGAILLLAAACHGAFAQISLGPNKIQFPTSDQLIAAAGDESTARVVVSEALRYHTRVFGPRTTTLLAAQIPESWLPEVSGVRFTRLADEAAREYFNQCGTLLAVHEFKKLTAEALQVSIAENRPCTVSGLELRFIRSQNAWRLDDHPGGGFGGGTSGCNCK